MVCVDDDCGWEVDGMGIVKCAIDGTMFRNVLKPTYEEQG